MLMKIDRHRPHVAAAPMKSLRWFAARLLRRLRDWLVIQNDIGRLEQLDDHMLADMGIKREEIADRVSGRC